MRKKYIVAVSGGVDSVVLLHKLMSVKPSTISYVVAHYDHGIRNDSADDAAFVSALAKQYDLSYVTEKGSLGSDTSEDEARQKRYEFLRGVMKAQKAEAIIVAHHQDDVLETMIVNILRGTGPRGLIGYTQSGVLRPLLHKTKQELIDYAKEHSLEWCEDDTNQDEDYLRNYVRIHLMPKLDDLSRGQLIATRNELQEKYIEIDSLAKKIMVQGTKGGEIYRSYFVVLPYSVQKECVATLLRLHGVTIDTQMIERAVIAIKTLSPNKHVELRKNVTLYADKKSVLLKVDKDVV